MTSMIPVQAAPLAGAIKASLEAAGQEQVQSIPIM